jgi:hypothetical protein
MDFRNRANAEAALATIIAKLTAAKRREIMRALGDPPNINNLPFELWQEFEAELRRKMAAELLFVYLLYLNQLDKAGIMPIDVERLPLQDIANASARRYSLQTVASKRSQLADVVNRRFLGEVTKREMQREITSIFGPDRAAADAVTEITRAVSMSGEAGRAAAMLDGRILTAIWNVETDGFVPKANVCPICRPFHLQPPEVWSIKFPLGPPVHPSCQCFLTYQRE